MFVIMGASGNTGGAVARMLLQQNESVRVVLRTDRAAKDWEGRGAAVAYAGAHDVAALTAAFSGARAVYVLNPPAYAVDDMVAPAHKIAEAYRGALTATGVRAVALSSIGAQHSSGTGNIVTTHILEQVLASVGATFVRAGNFMNNWLSSLPAMRTGLLPSFLAPLDRPVPQVAIRDIARVVVRELLRGDTRTVEVGTQYSPDDVAAAFASALGHQVSARVVERGQWEQTLRTWVPAGAVTSWTEMWDGFNSGHVGFEGVAEQGQVTIEDFAKNSVTEGQA